MESFFARFKVEALYTEDVTHQQAGGVFLRF